MIYSFPTFLSATSPYFLAHPLMSRLTLTVRHLNLNSNPAQKYAEFNFRKVNFDAFNLALTSNNWDHVLSVLACDQALGNFYNILSNLLICNINPCATCSYPIWFTSEIHKSMDLPALRKKFVVPKNVTDLAQFNAVRPSVKTMYKITHKKYLVSVKTDLARDALKPLWSYIRYYRSPTQSSPTSINFVYFTTRHSTTILQRALFLRLFPINLLDHCSHTCSSPYCSLGRVPHSQM